MESKKFTKPTSFIGRTSLKFSPHERIFLIESEYKTADSIESEMKTKIVSRVLQAFAVYLFVMGTLIVISKVNTIRTGKKTYGKVVSSYKEFDYSTQTRGKSYGTSHYILRPIIQYQVDGEIYEIHGQIFGEVGKEYTIGLPVPLYYLPNQPDYAIINTFSEIWVNPIQKLLFSLIVFILGTFLPEILNYAKRKFVSIFQNPFHL